MLHIHADAGQDARLQMAIDLTRIDNGRIACVQVAAIEPDVVDFQGGTLGWAILIDTMHQADKQLRQTIETRLRREAVAWDWRCCDGGTAKALITQSRLADIVVASSSIGEPAHLDLALPIIGDVIIHTSAPVLVAPPGSRHFDVGGAAILAWNGSAEAAHAMRLAVPLLQQAACVHVVEVGGDAPGIPANDAATYLARHGVACDVHEWPAKGRRTSVALLHAIAELGAHYMVMGAYGHDRRHEQGPGGITRQLLQSATVPLVLAH